MRRLIAGTLIGCAFIAVLTYAGLTIADRYRKATTPQSCTVNAGGWEVILSAEQARNASIIVAESIARGLPETAAVVAIATAYQESGLRNLDYGDRDSVGLFQQRPSQGWGTVAEIMDPWYSAGKFYEVLASLEGWQEMSVNDAAQAVQRSGFPDAYAQHESNAVAVAAALRGSAPATLWCLNFADAPANAEAFSAVLAAFGEAVSSTALADGGYELRASDEATLWAAAQHVVANTYQGGVTRVQVGSLSWVSDTAGWAAAKAQGDALTAVVTLG